VEKKKENHLLRALGTMSPNARLHQQITCWWMGL